jgi:hypothetical protein
MPVPLIGAAAAAAAKVISKKLAQRAVGGITGGGARSVNPVYKEVGPTVKVVKPNPNTISNLNNMRSLKGHREQEYKRVKDAAKRLAIIKSE